MEKRIVLSAFLIVVFILTACGGQATVEPTVAPPSPTAQPDLPKILSTTLDRMEVPKYESV